MTEAVQMQLQVDMFATNIKVQLIAIAKDIYLAESPNERKDFLEIYRTLAYEVFGKPQEQETKPQV